MRAQTAESSDRLIDRSLHHATRSGLRSNAYDLANDPSDSPSISIAGQERTEASEWKRSLLKLNLKRRHMPLAASTVSAPHQHDDGSDQSDHDCDHPLVATKRSTTRKEAEDFHASNDKAGCRTDAAVDELADQVEEENDEVVAEVAAGKILPVDRMFSRSSNDLLSGPLLRPHRRHSFLPDSSHEAGNRETLNRHPVSHSSIDLTQPDPGKKCNPPADC